MSAIITLDNAEKEGPRLWEIVTRPGKLEVFESKVPRYMISDDVL
jgi:hypothetical protein